MSRRCDVTGKGSKMTTRRKLLRGNLNPTTKTRVFPNLQTLRYPGGKLKVSTRALKDIKRKAEKMNMSAPMYVKNVLLKK